MFASEVASIVYPFELREDVNGRPVEDGEDFRFATNKTSAVIDAVRTGVSDRIM